MKPINQQLFDNYCALIFDKLYQGFPVCQNFNTAEFTYQHQISSPNKISDTTAQLVFSETMTWLNQNGLISWTTPERVRPQNSFTHNYFNCVSLTTRGISILKHPASTELKLNDKVLGDKISELTSQGAVNVASGLLVNAIDKYI
jgi:hypothetical protein